MSQKPPLAHLKQVPLRTYWEREDFDFTPWLSQPDNISLLGAAVGLDLEVEAREKNVGIFRADILCKDQTDHSWVVIENQLERTDHAHLGQLLTYAAGLDAITIIWVAQSFTEEHRAALDWLNTVTDSAINFFGLEMELWQIADSPLAPKFNVVSQPNHWRKIIAKVKTGSLSSSQQKFLEFWQGFHSFLEHQPIGLKVTNPTTRNWLSSTINRSHFNLYLTVYPKTQIVSVGIWLSGSHKDVYFQVLQNVQDEIEKEIGHALEWNLNQSQTSHALLLRAACVEFSDLSQREVLYKQLYELAVTFHQVFDVRIEQLNTAELPIADEKI